MKTLLKLCVILFCAMLVACSNKPDTSQVESNPDEPSQIQSADNTGTDVGNSSTQKIDTPSDPPNSNNKSPIEPNVSPAETTVHMVTAREYFAEFEGDKVALAEKYKDGAIEISGDAIIVAHGHGATFIKLDVGRDETTGVHCFTKDKQPWAIVVPGQQVTLRGKLPSRLFGAQVQDCEILNTGPSPAIKIDAAALAFEYAADQDACTEKYKERYLYVDGTVEAIDTKAGIVHLAGNDGVRIRCSFHTYGEQEQIPSLKPGDQVHVIGQYPRFGGNATEMQLILCLLYDPSQVKPVPALKANDSEPTSKLLVPRDSDAAEVIRPKRTADSTTVVAKYPDDFRPNASGHADSSGHGKWFYQSSETQNPSSPEANLRQLSWDEGRKRYQSPLRGKNNTFPSIDERMHPSPDRPHFAVLRWQSRDSASIRVRGNFSKLADAERSNGVRALVFVDGEQVFDQEVGPRDAKGVDFDFAALVKRDSVVDFVVDPKHDAFWDSTKLIVTIEQLGQHARNQAQDTVALDAKPKETAGSKPDFSLASHVLYDDFEKDKKAAQAKYKGKIIEIEGVIEGDPLFDPDSITVSSFHEFGYLHKPIVCKLHPSELPKREKLWNRQSVKIKGKCEYWFGVHLEDCVFTEIGEPVSVIKVKAGNMISEFYADLDAAKMKYDHKFIEVEGLVAAKGEGGGSLGWVAIKGMEEEKSKPIRLKFGYVVRHREMIAKYNIGDKIKVKGTCTMAWLDDKYDIYVDDKNEIYLIPWRIVE